VVGAALILHRDHGAGLQAVVLKLHQIADVFGHHKLLVDGLKMAGAAVSKREGSHAD